MHRPFTAIHSLSVSPAPPSTEQITAAEIVDCVPGFRYRGNQTQSRALAYEAPSVVQTMGSTSEIVDCVHGFRYRSNQTQSRALAYEAPSVVQTMGSTGVIEDQ